MKPNRLLMIVACTGAGLLAAEAQATGVVAGRSKVDMQSIGLNDAAWEGAAESNVGLMAQPMVPPRPKVTTTNSVGVRALHDGKWVTFRLKWKDTDYNEGGRPGEYSDAVAIQFPVKEGAPPPVFMGAKDNPVHIFHWRAQYKADKERGLRSMKDLYPNMEVDLYPLELKDAGNIQGLNDEVREVFSHGRAAGNPQSYKKTGVDEIFAEGFGTSSVIEAPLSASSAEWKDGEWTVLIRRALNREKGSVLVPGKASFLAFAVWQGGKDEVGGRKSVTMTWTPLQIKE